MSLVKHALFATARQCWEQGLAAQAMLETGDEEMLVLMARDCVVRQNPDGRLADVESTPALVDPALCVEPVLAAGRITGEEMYALAAERNVQYLLNDAPRTPDGARYQLAGSREVWADSLGMGPHVLMLSGHVEEGLAFYRAVKARLYDPATGLFRHKWDEASGAYARKAIWGVGNGWALTGLMRAAGVLKAAGDSRLDFVLGEFCALMDAMGRFQRPDGLFHDVMDDPASFPEVESAEMFAYSLYNMISWGLIPGGCRDRADRARNAARARVDRWGLVQGGAGSPWFDKPGTSAETQAHFLMMERAAEG
jgi:unsaturated rhamnogalacturonyl hydrolase